MPFFPPPDDDQASWPATWGAPGARVPQAPGATRRRGQGRPKWASASPEMRMAVLARDNFTCQLCGCALTIHDRTLPTHGVAGHIVSHLDGGLPTGDNLRAECWTCSTQGGAVLQRKAMARRRALERQQAARDSSSWG